MRRWCILIFFFIPSLVQAQPREGESALSEWVSLQAGLYQVVSAFDAQAEAMGRWLRFFERKQMEAHLEKMTGEEKEETAAERRAIQKAYESVGAEPGLCAGLNEALSAYVNANMEALTRVTEALVQETSGYDEAARAEFASRLRVSLAGMEGKRRAQEIMWFCLYKDKDELGRPREYSVERTMKAWYRIQEPLITSWIGEVD